MENHKSKSRALLIPLEWRQTFDALPDRDAAALLRAAFAFAQNAQEATLPRAAAALWPLLRSAIERDKERYSSICEKRRSAVKARWDKEKQPEEPKEKEEKNGEFKSIHLNTSEYNAIQQHSNLNLNLNLNKNINSATPEASLSCFSFEAFWNAYGLKKDKSKCEAKYRRVPEADREKIRTALPGYVAATFTDGRFPSRKYPMTWLSGQCWNDEPAGEGAKEASAGEERTEQELQEQRRKQMEEF